jgi:phosphoenolpyruvate phosphomutase / 2-hydroxyethylphosphonate cytidylyltransferase
MAEIKTGIEARVTRDFMIVSRIESLILQQGMDDAVARAKAYVEAGTDAVMIHSREKDPAEILEFCEHFSKFDKRCLSLPCLQATTRFMSMSFKKPVWTL